MVIEPIGKSIPRIYKTFWEEVLRAHRELEDSITNSSMASLDTTQLEASIKEVIVDRLDWQIPPYK